MRRRLTAAMLIAVLSVFGAACDDTVGGIEEDVEEGVDEVDEEMEEDPIDS